MDADVFGVCVWKTAEICSLCGDLELSTIVLEVSEDDCFCLVNIST